MKDTVIVKDTLRLITYEECKVCETRDIAIGVGAYVVAPNGFSGEPVEGELVQVHLRAEPRTCTGSVMQVGINGPRIVTVSMFGPITVLCRCCKRHIGTVSLWT